MILALQNLQAEFRRKGLRREDVARRLCMDADSLVDKLEGDAPFTVAEAFQIKQRYFPEFTLDYLFADSPETTPCNRGNSFIRP